MNKKEYFDDETLSKVAGGIRITSENVAKYVAVLTKCPGIVDRVKVYEITDEDERVILMYFNTVEYFITFCKYADGRNVEQLLKDAVD